jgi:hypothetical protein
MIDVNYEAIVIRLHQFFMNMEMRNTIHELKSQKSTELSDKEFTLGKIRWLIAKNVQAAIDYLISNDLERAKQLMDEIIYNMELGK